ncbi:MAG: Spx/MgsR family RNA polymerase-binding regulatory protein [Pseudomonadota bacterium]|nr:Spx/MgsR family RNA polymerase-binding regulatory protein [Pseudomonadota bacterium]
MIYGIKNCSTMTKAFTWLAERGYSLPFHNYKLKGIDSMTLKRWCNASGWENLINRKGLTWKKLKPEEKENVKDMSGAIELMQLHPSLIRRPVVEQGENILVGFNPEVWSHYFPEKE